VPFRAALCVYRFEKLRLLINDLIWSKCCRTIGPRFQNLDDQGLRNIHSRSLRSFAPLHSVHSLSHFFRFRQKPACRIPAPLPDIHDPADRHLLFCKDNITGRPSFFSKEGKKGSQVVLLVRRLLQQQQKASGIMAPVIFFGAPPCGTYSFSFLPLPGTLYRFLFFLFLLKKAFKGKG